MVISAYVSQALVPFHHREKQEWEGRDNAMPPTAIRTVFEQPHLSALINLLQPHVL